MRNLRTIALAVLALLPIAASAATSCSASAAPPQPLAFGVITQSSPAHTSVAVITVVCPAGQHYTVGLKLQSGSLRNGISGLPFHLFQNAALTQPWGNTQGVDTYAGVGTGQPQLLPVYGQIPAAATLPHAGNYTAVVSVILRQ